MQLSLEEEDLLIEEAHEASNRVDVMLNEAERAAAIGNAMGETAIIIDSVEPLTPRDIVLVDKIAQTAVGDSSSETILPSMEAYVGKPGYISCEGLYQTAHRVLEIILEAMRRAWEAVREFIVKFAGQTARHRRQVSKAKNRLAAAKDADMTHGTVSFDVLRSVYQREGKAPNNAAELISAYEDVYKVTDYMTHFAPLAIGQLSVKIKEAFSRADSALSNSNMDKDAGQAVIDAASQTVVREAIQTFDTLKSRMTSQFHGSSLGTDPTAGYTEVQSNALLDNASLYGFFPIAEAGHDVDVDRLKNAEVMVSFSSKSYPPPIRIKPFTTPTLSETRRLLDIADKLVGLMEDDSELKKLDSMASQLALISESLTKKVEARFGIAGRGDLSQFRSLVSLNASLAQWSAKPSLSAKRYASRITTAIMIVVDDTLKAYEV